MPILQHYTNCTIGYYTLSLHLLEYQADRYLPSVELFDIISLISVKTIASFHMKDCLPLLHKSKSIHVVLLIIDLSRIIPLQFLLFL